MKKFISFVLKLNQAIYWIVKECVKSYSIWFTLRWFRCSACGICNAVMIQTVDLITVGADYSL